MFVNLTCINQTPVYFKHKAGPKEVRFRQVSLYQQIHSFIFGGGGRKWWVCTQTTEKRGLISIPTLMACVVLGLASAIILYRSLCDERLSLTTALLARLFPLFCNKNCKIKFKCFHPKFKILQNIFHITIVIYHE